MNYHRVYSRAVDKTTGLRSIKLRLHSASAPLSTEQRVYFDRLQPNESAPSFDLGGSNSARISAPHDFKL
jgi:hypothetical protein